jgi:hypothetical protein
MHATKPSPEMVAKLGEIGEVFEHQKNRNQPIFGF